ncbi:MAG: DUF2165 family protein [Sphingomonadaceae bacterium]
MAVRLLKAVLVLCAGLQSLLYALQNIANLDPAFGAVAYVLSNADHVVYPNSIGPAITSAPLVWIALTTIIALETLAGLIAIKGAHDLYRARGADAAQFDAAKTAALIGCGLGMIVWFGFFLAIGGAYFQMWQTEVGGSSFDGAFVYMLTNAAVYIIVAMRERDPARASSA